MKWLFSILVIANLGMFIWLFPQHDGQSSERISYENIGELWLVGETQGRPSSGESRPIVQVPAPAVQDVPEEPEEPEEPAEPAVVVSEAPVESPQIPPVEAPPLASTGDDTEATAPVEPPTLCGDVGFFDKRSEAELLSVRMLAQGLKTEIASELSNEQAGFWVLIPPQKDRDAAIEIAKRLEAAGVADIWRFTSGNLAHAISLGLFRDEERAQARKEQIAGMGFKPEVRPRYREHSRYWLNYTYTGESPLKDDFWREVSDEFPDLKRNEQPCP